MKWPTIEEVKADPQLQRDVLGETIVRLREALAGGPVWEVQHHNDLSAVWAVLDGDDWHACVEMSRLVDSCSYDAWLAVGLTEGRGEEELYCHVGPFDSIEAARRTANAMAVQYLIENGRLDEAMTLGETLPSSVRQELRSPEEDSYDDGRYSYTVTALNAAGEEIDLNEFDEVDIADFNSQLRGG